MSKKDYDIDDILQEAQRLRDEKQGGKPASAPKVDIDAFDDRLEAAEAFAEKLKTEIEQEKQSTQEIPSFSNIDQPEKEEIKLSWQQEELPKEEEKQDLSFFETQWQPKETAEKPLKEEAPKKEEKKAEKAKPFSFFGKKDKKEKGGFFEREDFGTTDALPPLDPRLSPEKKEELPRFYKETATKEKEQTDYADADSEEIPVIKLDSFKEEKEELELEDLLERTPKPEEPKEPKAQPETELGQPPSVERVARKTVTAPKKDLFDFKPQRREKPIITDEFGQKRFDFGKEAPQSPAELAGAPPKNVANQEFDFDSISDKIDKLQEDQDHDKKSPRPHQNPLDYDKAPESLADRRSSDRYSKLVFGDGSGSAPPSTPRFDFEATPHQQGEADKKKRNIFGTFATGTGQELKIEDIQRIDFSEVEGSGSGYYPEDEYYDDDLPDSTYVSFNEYGPTTDRRDVARDIANTKMGLFLRTVLTGLLTFVLFYFSFSGKHDWLPMPPFLFPQKETLVPFLMACTAMLGIIAVACGKAMISGIVNLFRMRANSDTLPAFAIIAAIIQLLVAMRYPETVNPQAMNLYYPIAALSMFFNCIGKLSMLGRIQQNFKVAAANQDKYAVLEVQSPTFSKDLLPNYQGRPTVAHSAKSDFFSEYMALSFSNKYDVGVYRSVAPVCIIGGVIVALATRLLTLTPETAPMISATAFAAVMSICATFSSTFIENVPLAKMAKKLTPVGAMVSGNKAVETFCDTDAIVLTENDLFPKGHVYLNGIKAFPNAQIDEAILDAASVLCVLDGSLSHVFLEMIGGNRKLLKKVDNVVYENGMGLSGWVDGRRVLIGNRKLMQNHGVELPSDSYERAHPHDTPGNPLYLSNTGQVSARFLLEYVIDEELAYQLDLLAAKEKHIVVYTTDANINAEKIWQAYSYPLDLVTIMPSELQDTYREIAQPRKETPAEIIYTGRPASFVAAILATINARASILYATVVQLVQIMLGYGMVALMSFMGYISDYSVNKMVLYQLFWFAVTMVIQQTRKP